MVTQSAKRRTAVAIRKPERTANGYRAAGLSRGELASAVAAQQLTDEDSSDASPLSDKLKRKMLYI
ncbi:MAG: hypothetical protein LBM00_04980 [Deltaproteobacteria bacterium]|nr:hypothetical protein [Deltaproteobacteria bacterium]